jgi:crotonobetainyl-CoA:carnitine CoA-transferase CaiB-like acyl-CoA transferase
VAVPTLGEHTDEVLREILELDDTALERLRDAYAIGGDDRDD